MKRSPDSSLTQRLALVGGGIAALAGAAFLARGSRFDVGQAVRRWLGHGDNGAPPHRRGFLDSGSTTSKSVPPLFQERALDVHPCDAIWSKPGATTAHECAVNVVLTISRSELNEGLQALFPLRIALSSTEADAWLDIEALDGVKYEPGQGVVVRCAAHFNYPVAILPDTYRVHELVLTISPEMMMGASGPVLAFKLEVADIDVKSLPDFVDNIIASKVNGLLRDHSTKIAWDFSSTLDRVLTLPKRVSHLKQIGLGPARGSVEVANEGLVLRFAIPLTFVHTPVPAALPT